MRDWQAKLDHWVRVWGRLPELTQDCFPLHPSSGIALPPALRSCAALADFYSRCDGGRFGAYDLSRMAELRDLAADEWLASSPGLERMKPGGCLALGGHEFGHILLWDRDADQILLYSPDDMAPRRLRRTMAAFLERLFYPSAKASNESVQMWAEALAEADKVA
jgi:hypothetical protein